MLDKSLYIKSPSCHVPPRTTHPPSHHVGDARGGGGQQAGRDGTTRRTAAFEKYCLRWVQIPRLVKRPKNMANRSWLASKVSIVASLAHLISKDTYNSTYTTPVKCQLLHPLHIGFPRIPTIRLIPLGNIRRRGLQSPPTRCPFWCFFVRTSHYHPGRCAHASLGIN